MTDSVTPRAPDPPLVDPETGETAPLSPQSIPVTAFLDAATLSRAQPFLSDAVLYREWNAYEAEISAHLEPDDAA